MKKVVVKFNLDRNGIVEIVKIGSHNQYDEYDCCGDLYFSYAEMLDNIDDLVDLYYPEELYGKINIIFKQVNYVYREVEA
jgi:hypothetical protein